MMKWTSFLSSSSLWSFNCWTSIYNTAGQSLLRAFEVFVTSSFYSANSFITVRLSTLSKTSWYPMILWMIHYIDCSIMKCGYLVCLKLFYRHRFVGSEALCSKRLLLTCLTALKSNIIPSKCSQLL